MLDGGLFAGGDGEGEIRSSTLGSSSSDDNKDEITALQILYSQPHGRVAFKDIKALADAIHAPPRSWTPEMLWGAYEKLADDKVKGRARRGC